MSSETRRVPNKRRFDPAELMVGGDHFSDGSRRFSVGTFNSMFTFDDCFGWLLCESLSPSGCKTSGWDLLKFE